MWKEATDYAAFFPGTLAECVLELDALCRRLERGTDLRLPTLSCDELGAEHLGFSLSGSDLDLERDGLSFLTRLAQRDERVSRVSCVSREPGFVRFRVSYRPR